MNNSGKNKIVVVGAGNVGEAIGLHPYGEKTGYRCSYG